MDDLGGDFTGTRIQQGNGVVQFDESKIFAWFKREAKHMPAKSEAAGHEVWDELDYIYVQQAGDMHPVKREKRPGDELRYPRAWAAYQAGQKPAMDGTPINILFPASPSMSKNLEGVGVFTIEQLASVSDSALTNIPMGMDLRNKAISFLKARDGADGFNKMQAQLDRERERSNSLELQMAEMQRTMATMAAQRESDPGNNVSVSPSGFTEQQLAQIRAMFPQPPEKRGPGRPPKAQE